MIQSTECIKVEKLEGTDMFKVSRTYEIVSANSTTKCITDTKRLNKEDLNKFLHFWRDAQRSDITGLVGTL